MGCGRRQQLSRHCDKPNSNRPVTAEPGLQDDDTREESLEL